MGHSPNCRYPTVRICSMRLFSCSPRSLMAQKNRPFAQKSRKTSVLTPVAPIRFRPHLRTGSYVLVVLRHYYFNKFFAKIAAGVGINHLSAAKFSVIPFPLAPIAEQEEIASE